jgi:hypothetical protein
MSSRLEVTGRIGAGRRRQAGAYDLSDNPLVLWTERPPVERSPLVSVALTVFASHLFVFFVFFVFFVIFVIFVVPTFVFFVLFVVHIVLSPS